MASRKVVCENEEGSVRMVFEVDACKECPKWLVKLAASDFEHGMTKGFLMGSRTLVKQAHARENEQKNEIQRLRHVLKQKDKLFGEETEKRQNVTANFKQQGIWYKECQRKYMHLEASFEHLKVIAARKDNTITQMQKEAGDAGVEIEQLKAKLGNIMRVLQPEPGMQ